MVKIRELDGIVKEFATNELAIEHIRLNDLKSFSIWDEQESYTFFGGALLMMETSEVLVLGSTAFKK